MQKERRYRKAGLQTEGIDWEDAIVCKGNQNRLKKLFHRAQSGEKLTIGFLGGSITQGFFSSKPELCFASRVFRWWEENFPQAEFTYVNAGIGGTTSEFAAARVESDLLEKRPDFVIVDFSVNDENREHFLETYEGVVRRVYRSAGQPAMLLLHNVYYHNGSNAQDVHVKAGRHYKIPCISMKNSLYPEVAAGRIAEGEITPDHLHPNDRGHELIASAVLFFLEKVFREREEPEGADDAMPAPMTANRYEYSVRYRADNSLPVCRGFTADTDRQKDMTDCFKKGWTAGETGASVTFEIEAKCIAVQYRKSVKLPAPVAEAVVDGDREHAVILDANFEETWGDKLELDTVAEYVSLGRHTVTVTVTETHENDAVPFYLASVIGAK